MTLMSELAFPQPRLQRRTQGSKAPAAGVGQIGRAKDRTSAGCLSHEPMWTFSAALFEVT